MHSRLLEIGEYHGEGYRPLIDSADWRVAILRWAESMLPEKMDTLERHTQTDEVFVLLKGQATLFVSDDCCKVDRSQAMVMEQEKLYNVKRNTWHSIILSRDAIILIVENQDTNEANTEYCRITEDYKRAVLYQIKQE